MGKITEAKLITYLSKRDVGEDIHIVKEVDVENNNIISENTKIIKNFKRPFWVTKEIFRNHKDKKETEQMHKTNMFLSTDSDLPYNIAPRLGDRYVGVKDMRIIKDSPYIYGIDVDARTYLKKLYMKNSNNQVTPYRVGALDIEVDTKTNKLIVISLTTHTDIYVAVHTSLTNKYSHNKSEVKNKILELYDKYIPDVELKSKVKLHIEFFTNEILMFKYIFQKANYANIDFLAIWNMTYELGILLDKCEEYNIPPEDLMHYEEIPSKYKFFKYKKGPDYKVTASGKFKSINPEERWDIVTSTTNFKIIDAMCAYNYIRVGGKRIPGGYSLDNILRTEKIPTKLKFDDDKDFKGLEWHIYMVENKPIEYIIYNIWDTMSMIILDDKTKDLSISLPLLSGISHFDIFNSGPKRIIDAINFFYLERKLVLGTKPMKVDTSDKGLGLDEWIVTLQSYKIDDNGLRIIAESPYIPTNIRILVADADAVSSYPSNIMAANVSKDTTHRELLAIEGIDKSLFKLQNINLMYGPTNAVEYCTNMFNMPSLYQIEKQVLQKIKNQ